ncbi:MAG: hypothetical protein ACXVB4_12180 [Pseudobdellovibrionaceae bacterium]
MRQKRFLIYLIVEFALIISVVFIFKLNSNVKLASVQAGILFILLPMVLGGIEWKRAGFFRKSFYIGLLQFWVLFALPILGLRLLNWDVAFNELSVLGVQGTILHKYANFSYILMMALTLWNYLRSAK